MNSIRVVVPVSEDGAWLLDEFDIDLKQEPFVLGIPDMLLTLRTETPGADAEIAFFFGTLRSNPVQNQECCILKPRCPTSAASFASSRSRISVEKYSRPLRRQAIDEEQARRPFLRTVIGDFGQSYQRVNFAGLLQRQIAMGPRRE